MQFTSRLRLAALAGVFVAASLNAAEPRFVGILAVAVEDATIEKLMITAEQKEALLKIIDERETKALSLAVGLKDASPQEQEEKLAPFRKQSEAEGLAILNDEQRALLEQVRLQKAGPAALAEAGVAETLKLSDEQKTSIQKLLADREAEMARTSDRFRRGVRGNYDRRLMDALDETQRKEWAKLAGLPEPAAPLAQPAQNAEARPEPPANEPPREAVAKPAAPKGDGKLRFNFRYTPWPDVLDWFAQQADLSLETGAGPPQGTFNYTDSRSYTPAEAIDLLNSVLLTTKGYTLVRRNRMLFLINLEDGIPPILVPDVKLDELESKGEYELVTVLFRLDRITPEEAEAEINRIKGPQGSIVTFPKAGLIRVTETAGRLKQIRAILSRIDPAVLNPVENTDGTGTTLRVFELKHQETADVLGTVRLLLDIPPDQYASTDGTLRMALDPATGKLLVAGRPDKVAKVEEILKVVDVPVAGTGTGAAGAVEAPQFEVYPISGADPNSVLAVLQTMLASFPDVRLALDPKTFNLMAQARPAQHATIKATIAQMERDVRRVEVIRLARVEPTVAVAAINKLFGAEGGAGQAPTVDADPVSRQLLVRGSEGQITQIRSLLEKMGESGATGGADGKSSSESGSNVRMLPLTNRSVRSAMEQVEKLWSTMRPNRIQVVTPSAVLPTKRASESGPQEPLPRIRPAPPAEAPAADEAAPEKKDLPPATPLPQSRDARNELRPGGVPVRQASAVYARPAQGSAKRVDRTVALTEEEPAVDGRAKQPEAASNGAAANEPPPIIVAPGPGATMIASEDVEALNAFVDLLTLLAGKQFAGSQYTVFYLANANAQVVAETLESIFLSGGASTGGGSSLIGDLAGSVIGGTAGSLVGSLLGGGSGSSGAAISSTGVQIIPETRLNALIVRAGPADLDLIETLLNVLDTSEVPESGVAPRPRMIPVMNTSAAQIAEIVKEVYSERLAGNRGSSQRQPSPEDFLQMLRGGGGSSGRGGSSSRRTAADASKIAVSVDSRTNSLIVAAPQQLFEEVEQFVKTLDYATASSNTAMKVISLKRSNPSTVQKALTAIAGEKVRSDRQVSDGGGSSGSSSRGGGDSSDAEAMRRRIEFFNSMRGGSSGSPFGGGSSPFGGGFDRSRSFGSGGSSFGGSRDGGRDGGGSRDGGSSRGRD